MNKKNQYKIYSKNKAMKTIKKYLNFQKTT